MARRVVVRSQCIDIAVTRVTARTGIWLSVPFSRSARGTRLRLRRWCALSGGLRSVPRTSSPAGSRRSRDLDCAAWLLPRRAAARCGATGNPTRRGGRSSRGKSGQCGVARAAAGEASGPAPGGSSACPSGGGGRSRRAGRRR
jgi:hypothetical protein